MRRRLSTIDTWADDPEIERPPRYVHGSDQTVIVDHVDVVLGDGTRLYFAKPGCQ